MILEVESARAGASVVWVAQRLDDARAALNAHHNLHPEDVARITRACGSERIDYKSGGRIRYVAVRSQGGRGFTADLLSLTHADYCDADLMVRLLPCLATSNSARVAIRPS